MALIRWDPWEELERVRSHMDQVWSEFFERLNEAPSRDREPIGFIPDVDLVETAHEYRVYVSLPGIVEEDIDLLLEKDTLTIRGEREPPYDVDQHSRPRSEWRYGYFERRLRFPTGIKHESVRARYESGVLKIVLPK